MITMLPRRLPMRVAGLLAIALLIVAALAISLVRSAPARYGAADNGVIHAPSTVLAADDAGTADGVGGTGRVTQDGVGGTGHVTQDGVGGTGHVTLDGVGGTGR
jgi:hypothetical protein